ncbi:MAG TPA: hypothetical protein PLU36_03675 [Chitinophagaceae bacterium]|nr:hypothetical protein [Chitinophagaceae bacterium]MCC6634400.1 hypothetical protein [Chitinophagaceae bacterium]HMZ45881.1 hypothetical protein [Chitinophagaceae bacterium]HNE92837.1 hypothetical protein [Chitinophagaceae bacterium]HNF29175.1 hypothetical protein [Chitinophagaceae bacterium]
MEQQHKLAEEQNKQDFTKSWVSSSRFLFYLLITCMMASTIGGCFKLYKSKYKGTPEYEIQGSTKYTPDYK